LHRHAVERDRLRWARASPHVPDEPIDELLVVGTGGAQAVNALGEVVPITPLIADLAQLAPPLVFVRSPRVVGGPETTRRRVVENERVRPLGVGGGEQERDPRALLRGPEDSPIGTRG